MGPLDIFLHVLAVYTAMDSTLVATVKTGHTRMHTWQKGAGEHENATWKEKTRSIRFS